MAIKYQNMDNVDRKIGFLIFQPLLQIFLKYFHSAASNFSNTISKFLFKMLLKWRNEEKIL